MPWGKQNWQYNHHQKFVHMENIYKLQYDLNNEDIEKA